MNGVDGDMENDLPDIPSSSAAGAASSPTRGPVRQASTTPRQPTPGPSNGRLPTPGASNGILGSHVNGTPAPAILPLKKKKKTTISYDKYQLIKSLVVLKLSEMERETGEGVSRPEIVTWYLEQRENEIQTVEELEEERTLVEKVITKLIKEKQLLELIGQGLQDQESSEDSQAADPILMVHPDYEN